MHSATCNFSYLENWHWLGQQVRCALEPDEPRVIEHYLAEGRYLVCCRATPAWRVATASLRLLLETAQDVALPWHWRTLCLDQAYRPLRDVRRLAVTSEQHLECKRLCLQLSQCVLVPSLNFHDEPQGHPDE